MHSEAAESQVARRWSWDRMPSRTTLAVLLFVAVAIRGRVVASSIESLGPDPDGYEAVAQGLLWHLTFGPLDGKLQVAATAGRPPLYPLVLAIWELPSHFLLEGLGGYSIGVLHVLLGLGTIWAVWRLGLTWQLPPGGALVAASLITIDPILLRQSTLIMTETLATFLAAVSLLAITRAARENAFRPAMLAGAMLGLCVLCRPTFLIWLVLVAGAFLWQALGERRLKRLLSLGACSAAILAPWAARNYYVFDAPIVTTTHGGFTLLLANNPEFYEHISSQPWQSTWNGVEIYDWYDNQSGFTSLRWNGTYDEPAADREAYKQAWENISAQPGLFAYSCLVRVARLWNVLPHQLSPDESTTTRGLRWAVAIWYAFEFALAAIGLWFVGRGLLREPWIWGTLLVVSFTAVHAFYWTDMRMRAPLMVVIALLAGQALVRIASRRPATSLSPQAT